jgi:hypothetical protein
MFLIKYFFGRFSAAFVKKWRPYGRQFSLLISFFFRPVLSYFAEFSASGNSGQHQQTKMLMATLSAATIYRRRLGRFLTFLHFEQKTPGYVFYT